MTAHPPLCALKLGTLQGWRGTTKKRRRMRGALRAMPRPAMQPAHEFSVNVVGEPYRLIVISAEEWARIPNPLRPGKTVRDPISGARLLVIRAETTTDLRASAT